MSYHALRDVGADENAPLLMTFHGTGGDESQLHGLVRGMMPKARVVSPRGDVSENGALRFFRRTGEGVYDMEDFWRRARAVADFASAEKAGAPEAIAVGYSNGANIAAAVAMLEPGLFERLALMHPLIPWQPDPQPGLAGRRILVTAGERDPICPASQTRALVGWLSDQGALVETVWHAGGHEVRGEELDALARFLS